MVKDGWTLADSCTLAPTLEAQGADYLSVTAGVMGGTRLTVPPLYEKQGCFVDLAEAVKRPSPFRSQPSAGSRIR